MRKVVAIITIMILIIGSTSCTKKETKPTDAIKFKEEYEKLNNQVSASKKCYSTIEIPEDNAIIYSNVEEILSLLDGKSGIVYFGYPECPWCRQAVPVLLNTANMVGIDQIYYFNIKEIRDIKKLDSNNNIITEKEGTSEYQDLLKALDPVLSPYQGLNDETIKRIYAPTVLFIKEGEVIGIQKGTINSKNEILNEAEEKKLSSIYSDYMHKILGDVCDESC